MPTWLINRNDDDDDDDDDDGFDNKVVSADVLVNLAVENFARAEQC